jgi:hypothetical protein
MSAFASSIVCEKKALPAAASIYPQVVGVNPL